MSESQKRYGVAWQELHAERDQVCEAIIRNMRERSCTSSSCSQHCQHRFFDRQLQELLRSIDFALDALMNEKIGERVNTKPVRGTDDWSFDGRPLPLTISDSEAGLRPASTI